MLNQFEKPLARLNLVGSTRRVKLVNGEILEAEITEVGANHLEALASDSGVGRIMLVIPMSAVLYFSEANL
jgi:hypothetical protein